MVLFASKITRVAAFTPQTNHTATFFSHPSQARLTEQICVYFNQSSGLRRPRNGLHLTCAIN